MKKVKFLTKSLNKIGSKSYLPPDRTLKYSTLTGVLVREYFFFDYLSKPGMNVFHRVVK